MIHFDGKDGQHETMIIKPLQRKLISIYISVVSSSLVFGMNFEDEEALRETEEGAMDNEPEEALRDLESAPAMLRQRLCQTSPLLRSHPCQLSLTPSSKSWQNWM